MRQLPVLACLVLLATAFALRAHDLGADCFDCDELYAVRIQGFGPRAIAAVMARDGFHTNHPPLMSVPFLAWTASFGPTETAVRSLPLAAGVLAVAAVFVFGWALGRPWAGVFGAFILAVNPLHITYCTEARQYALVTALIAVAHVLFVLALRFSRRAFVMAYYLVAAWAALTHYFAVPVLIGHAAAAAWLLRRPGPRRVPAARLFLAVGLVGLPYLAWLPVIRFQSRMKWDHLAPLTPGRFVDSLADLFGVGGWGAEVGLLLSLVVLALLAVGLWSARSDRISIAAPKMSLVPGWLGWSVLTTGLLCGLGFVAAFPRVIEPVARQALSDYGYDTAIVEEELGLLRLTAILGAGCVALGGIILLVWRRLEAATLASAPGLHALGTYSSTSAGALLFFFLFAPIFVIGLGGLTGIPFHQTRNLLVMLPAVCATLGFALERIGRTLPGSLAMVLLLALLAIAAGRYHAVGRVVGLDGPRLGIDTIDWRRVKAWLADHRDGGTVVLVKRPATDPALYYLAEYKPVRVSSDGSATLPPRTVFVHLVGNVYSERARDDILRQLMKAGEGDGWEVYVTNGKG